MAARVKQEPLYVGVDVGGTKILAVVTTAGGLVLSRARAATPRTPDSGPVVEAIVATTAEAMNDAGVTPHGIRGIGLAIPGVVNSAAGEIIVTPNMPLTGMKIVEAIGQRLPVPIVLGNDVDLGTLGEKWLGAARNASSAVGMFIGTGIGGGIILDGQLHRGSRDSAGEIGHMVMKINGPKCGCGGKGCLEALASRTAIERDLRQAMRQGQRSILTRLMDSRGGPIRSSVLAEALSRRDKLVTRVINRACEIIAQACLSVRHLLDPEVIVLGGGVLEACGFHMMPRILKVTASDPLDRAGRPLAVLQSALGDDAVPLGAVALARAQAGDDAHPPRAKSVYPTARLHVDGGVKVGDHDFNDDFYIRVDAKAKKRKRAKGAVNTDLVAKICKYGPETLFVATGGKPEKALTAGAARWLAYHGIELHQANLAEGISAYNRCRGRKALLVAMDG